MINTDSSDWRRLKLVTKYKAMIYIIKLYSKKQNMGYIIFTSFLGIFNCYESSLDIISVGLRIFFQEIFSPKNYFDYKKVPKCQLLINFGLVMPHLLFMCLDSAVGSASVS